MDEVMSRVPDFGEAQLVSGRPPEFALPRRAAVPLLGLGVLALLFGGEGGGQVQAKGALVGDRRENSSTKPDHYGPDPHSPDYISDWQPQCEGDDGGLIVGNEEFYMVGKGPNQRILSGGVGTEVASRVEVTMQGQDTCGTPYFQTRYRNARGELVVHTCMGRACFRAIGEQ